jgi:predicted DNA binding CopG/RHH family protein
MTPAEIEALKNVAWAHGLHMSTFVRELALAAIKDKAA